MRLPYPFARTVQQWYNSLLDSPLASTGPLTAAGIPRSLAPCFLEYGLEALDPAQHGDLLARSASKYPYARDFELMAVESMVLFENADRDLQPDLLIEVPWEQVRQFFVAQARALGERWFGD